MMHMHAMCIGACAVLLSVGASAQYPASTTYDAPAARYRHALAELMPALEQKIGISFGATTPEVAFADGTTRQYPHAGFIAKYEPDTNTILLSEMVAFCDLTHIVAGADRPIRKGEYLPPLACMPLAAIRDVLSHELGHYYTVLAMARYAPLSWLNEPHQRGQHELNTATQLGIPIIREGIGEYFGKALGHTQGRRMHFNEARWKKPTTEADLAANRIAAQHLVYTGGYTIVKPIIDHYGARGIRYLLTHPLTVTLPDLTTIPVYRERALRDLAEETKQHP